MSASYGLVYEVTLTIEREIVESFDSWLAGHVEEMLAIPGFVNARIFALEDNADGRARRVTHFYLESETHLEQYLSGQAAAMRHAALDRFGEQFSASRQVLRETDIAHGQIQPIETCLNCHTALRGQYCGNCGQRARSRLISLWELIRDAFGDLFELDSRIWNTMLPLLLRPGKLTREYLEGRRARFMPPFRTYLVLSIIFFLVLLFDPKEEFGILFEPGPETAEETVAKNQSADEVREELLAELEAEGLLPSREKKDISPTAGSTTAADEDQSNPVRKGSGVTVTEDDTDASGVSGSCDLDDLEDIALPAWLAQRLTRERLLAVCEKISADNGKALGTKLQDNIPAALFFLLPLMALILKLLYPLSKRYYVEHLLFVVHFHAFFFLMLILQMLFSRAGVLLRLPEAIANVALFATSLYIPVYLYKAMRRVYGQGHLATVPKYFGLIVAYAVGTFTIFGFAALLAAFSI